MASGPVNLPSTPSAHGTPVRQTKRRTSLPSLIEAMFYDLTSGDRSKIKIPKQPERRERELRDLMLKSKHPVVLTVDEAHDRPFHAGLSGRNQQTPQVGGPRTLPSAARLQSTR